MLMASARAKAAQEAKQQAQQQQQDPQAASAAQQPGKRCPWLDRRPGPTVCFHSCCPHSSQHRQALSTRLTAIHHTLTDCLHPPPGLLHAAPAAGGQHALAAGRPGTGLAAPCTHCGTVLVAESGALRQCCACLDVYCSCCSVIDYEEREDRVFCLGCLEEQVSGQPQGGVGTMPLGCGTGSVSFQKDTQGLHYCCCGQFGEAPRWLVMVSQRCAAPWKCCLRDRCTLVVLCAAVHIGATSARRRGPAGRAGRPPAAPRGGRGAGVRHGHAGGLGQVGGAGRGCGAAEPLPLRGKPNTWGPTHAPGPGAAREPHACERAAQRPEPQGVLGALGVVMDVCLRRAVRHCTGSARSVEMVIGRPACCG